MSEKKKIDWKAKSIGNLGAKRKTQLFVAITFLLVALITYNFIIYLGKAGVFKPAYRKPPKKIEAPVGMSEVEYKESVIAAMENKIESVQARMDSFSENIRREMGKQFKEQMAQIKEAFRKQRIATEAALSRTEAKIEKIDRRVDKLEARIDKTEQKILGKVESKLSSIKEGVDASLLPPPPPGAQKPGEEESAPLLPPPLIDEGEEEGGSPVLPPPPGSTGATTEAAPTPKKPAGYSFTMVSNEGIQKVIAAEQNETARLNQIAGESEIPEVDVALGFTKAYMITGAYAPVFGTSELGSIPVILEAEGKVLIPNEYTADVDKCFFIGGAVGDPSNDKILIKISKLQCIMADRTKQITGKVDGWVYDKYGTPGIHGTFISKTGRYIWRMVVAGILEGLGTGFVNYTASLANKNGNGGYSTVITGGAQGGGQGIQNAFSRLSDFYLKMAEKTLPALEAKGGQIVTVALRGGEKLQVTDFTPMDLPLLENIIDAEEY